MEEEEEGEEGEEEEMVLTFYEKLRGGVTVHVFVKKTDNWSPRAVWTQCVLPLFFPRDAIQGWMRYRQEWGRIRKELRPYPDDLEPCPTDVSDTLDPVYTGKLCELMAPQKENLRKEEEEGRLVMNWDSANASQRRESLERHAQRKKGAQYFSQWYSEELRSRSRFTAPFYKR